jgi:hypothetical protein
MLPALDDALTRLEADRSRAGADRRAALFRRAQHRRGAEALDMSPATAQAPLGLARAWLLRDLSGPSRDARNRGDACGSCSRRRSEREPARPPGSRTKAADDPMVRDEVLSLVEHHSRAGEFLARPIAGRRARAAR